MSTMLIDRAAMDRAHQQRESTRVDGDPVTAEDRAIFNSIAIGDRVTILVSAGAGNWREAAGKVVLLSRGQHATLNLGGAHGSPAIATVRNTVRVNKARKEAL